MLEVADRIRGEGGEVRFSSSGEVTRMIEGRGYACNDLPLADVRYDNGGFSFRETMSASPRIFARAVLQTRLESAFIRDFRPHAVLTDSALPTLMAARMAGLPSFSVLNQLSLSSSAGPKGVLPSLFSAGMTAGMGKLWNLSDEVFLPDLPPPFTISEGSLWGNRLTKTKYVGFMHSRPLPTAGPREGAFGHDHRTRIFWQVSGPPGTRGAFLEKALQTARDLSETAVTVVTGGDPSAATAPVEIPGGWLYGWCRSPWQFFDDCDVVVSRAGHGTVSQAILASKPSLLVPIPRQPEQDGNARKAERLGVARTMRQEELTTTTVAKLISVLRGEPYVSGARKLGSYAARFRAVENVAHTVMDAGRGRQAPDARRP
jgi:hypothetical protein